MKQTLITLILWTISVAAVAQRNQYADFQRTISEQRSSAAYLEKIADGARKANTPGSTYSVDTRAFYKNEATSGRFVPTPEQKKQMDAYEAEERVRRAKLSDEMSRWHAGKAPFISMFKAVGFFEREANYEAGRMVTQYGTPIPEEAHRIEVAGKKIYFDRIKDTASFDLIMLAVSGFEEKAPATAFNALQALKSRFPQNDTLLDLASIVNLSRYFRRYADIGSDDSSSLEIHFCKEYFKMAQKYPEMEKPFMQDLIKERNPYSIMDYMYSWYMQGAEYKSRKWKALYRRKEVLYNRLEAVLL